MLACGKQAVRAYWCSVTFRCAPYHSRRSLLITDQRPHDAVGCLVLADGCCKLLEKLWGKLMCTLVGVLDGTLSAISSS